MESNDDLLILNENIGDIHSIETFGSVDGPGVRLVIFFQGCIMRCKYCHNPDTWDLSKNDKSNVKQMNSTDILKLYSKNIDFYKKGGITVTGGEPLLQLDFLIELFSKAKEYLLPKDFVVGKNNSIHTTLDTSGVLFPLDDNESSLENYNCKLIKYNKLCEVTDLVLLDIKHVDNEKHIELTGHTNKNTLAFAKYLSEKKVPVVIRYVLVPSITDDIESLEKLADFISTLKNVQKIEILAYHDMAKTKYDALKIKYPLKDIRTATKEDVFKAQEVISNRIKENYKALSTKV